MTDAPVGALPPVESALPAGRLARAENLALAAVLAAMMTLPILEAILRKTIKVGISNQTAIVQNLVLVAGMIGGAIAARDGKLLALGVLEPFLKGRWRAAARIFTGAVAATIGAMLLAASIGLVTSEREAGGVVAYSVPRWLVQLVMPVGFALITARMLWRAADRWSGRAVAGGLAALLVFVAVRPPVAPAHHGRPPRQAIGAGRGGAPVDAGA